MRSTDDLKTDARIRDEAIVLFGRQGIAATTIRDVAEAAGVSAGLVIHHFGSKDGLRGACDDKVIEDLERMEHQAVSQPGSVSLADLGKWDAHMAYLSATLMAGGDGADRAFGRLCDLTETILDTGPLRMHPVADREAAIATIVAYTCGAALLGTPLARRLGGEKLTDPVVYARYASSALELFTRGLLTGDGWLEESRQAIAAAMTTDPDPPEGGAPPAADNPTTRSSNQE